MPVGEISINPALNFNPLGYMQQGAQLRSQNLSNQAAQTNLQTLSAMNNARLDYLNQLNTGQSLSNQKMQLLMQYVQPQAAAQLGQTNAQTGLIGAQTGLTNQQAQYFPVTAWGQMLNGLGRFGMAYSPGAILKYFPKDLQEPMARALVNGNTSFGNVSLPNTSALFGNALSLLPGMNNNRSSNGYNVSAGTSTPLSPMTTGNINSAPLSTPSGGMTPNTPLPMSPQQIQRLRLIMGGSPGAVNSSSVPPVIAPGSPNPAPQSAVNQYNAVSQAAQQNMSGSSQLQQKYNYAQNLAKTFNATQKNFGIPAITFSPYMGVSGTARLLADKAKIAAGGASPLYEKYRAFEDSVPVLSEQMTQFFGGSVQPQVQQQLDELQNPVTWDKNPGTAIRIYNNLQDLIGTEGMTAAKSVGKQNEYAQMMPQFNAKTYYTQLAQNPKYAADVVGALTPVQQQALYQYHLSLKGQH